MGSGSSAPPLIKQDYPVSVGIEKATMTWLAPSPGTSMQKKDRNSLRLARLLNVEGVNSIDPQLVCGIRLDFRICAYHKM
jgi:hypothetical protein